MRALILYGRYDELSLSLYICRLPSSSAGAEMETDLTVEEARALGHALIDAAAVAEETRLKEAARSARGPKS